MSRRSTSKLYVRPDSQFEIAKRAKGLLIRGECLGILPTPIDRLYDVAKVEEVAVDRGEMTGIVNRFSEAARDMLAGIMDKVRGAADLKKRVIFMPQDDTRPRILFARAHELGHQALSWHYLNRQYLDDDQTLSPRIKGQFETEANLFAAETIYQGDRFTRIARQYRPEFASVFELARMHGGSRHATFWRFVEIHDDAIAGLMYYPSNQQTASNDLQATFIHQNEVRSRTFEERYENLTLPGRLDIPHPWAQVRFELQQPVHGEISLDIDGQPVEFLWEGFWNKYCLMVLIRRRPPLQLVGGLLRRVRLTTPKS